MDTDITDAVSLFHEYAAPRVLPGSEPLTVKCTVAAAATPEEVALSWNGRDLPAELNRFWSVSREARLFEDVDYGQWGLALLSPEAAAQRTAQEHALRPTDYRDGDVVMGEFLGDLELLVMAPSESGTRRLLVSMPLDDRADWKGVAIDLADFLRRYAAATGDKYWEVTH